MCPELGSGIACGWSPQGRETGTKGAGTWMQRLTETPAFIIAVVVRDHSEQEGFTKERDFLHSSSSI